jgi:Holliday junction resolvase
MHRYVKGARSERELLSSLEELEYSVMRSAGSGVNSISPDIIAFKEGKGYAFECKAWERGSIAIPVDKFECLKRWERNTGMETFLAWRMNGKGWYFIKLTEMRKAVSNYTVTSKDAEAINRRFEIFTKCQDGVAANANDDYGV